MTRPLETLVALRSDFSRAAARRKAAALRALIASPLVEAAQVRTLHDALLFIAAYPDDATVSRLARDCLRELCRTVRRSKTLSRRQANSGIFGTTTTHEFSLSMLRWLATKFPRDVDIDWSDEEAIERLEAFLPHLVRSSERDGLYAEHLSTHEWVDLARGRMPAMMYLVGRFRRLECSPAIGETLLESLGLATRWKLIRSEASRSFARFPTRRGFHQREPILKKVELRTLMERRLPASVKSNRAATEQLLDACRLTLCTRNREIDTLTYVNPREVYFHQLERGIDVAVFGMSPPWRLPIESYFGFVAARNRVPVAYGGGWVLFDRCEIGVNIFDEFRGGESAYTFAQVLRVYRQLFKSTRIYVDPFQFGADNPEAIRSGAFWFYHRLGFRPTDAALQRLAKVEAQRIAARRGYRSPPAVLRRFAKGKLLLDLNAPSQDGTISVVNAERSLHDSASTDLDLTALSLATTQWIGKQAKARLPESGMESERMIRRLFGAWPMDGMTYSEVIRFEQLSLLLRPIEAEVIRWPAGVRRAIAETFRAKGGRKERDFARRLAAIPQLRDAWLRLASTAPKPERPAVPRTSSGRR